MDLVSPNHLVEETLDRGFGRQQQQESDDEISREKREAARKHYGMDDQEDDIARQKEMNKKTPVKSDRSTSPTASGKGV